MTETLQTPASAPKLRDYDFVGFVCVRPDGTPFWPSARDSTNDSLTVCFGAADAHRLDDLARQGWRCVPIAALTSTTPQD